MSDPYIFGVSEFTTWPWTFEQDVEQYACLGVSAIEICEFKISQDAVQAHEQIARVHEQGLIISSLQPRLHSLFPDAPRCFGDRAVTGQGGIDLPPLLSAIHETGCRGAYTLELFSESWLPDSLWESDLEAVILESRDALATAWRQASCS